ncbi:MAG TPA: hypothetical protein PKB07_19155 [Flavilitoribacter sp.]|nr:hypothetical protein [Flavilitoribacter sp.]
MAFKYNKQRYFFISRKSGSQALAINFISQLYPIDSNHFFLIIWDPVYLKSNYDILFENDEYKSVVDQYENSFNPVLLLVNIPALFGGATLVPQAGRSAKPVYPGHRGVPLQYMPAPGGRWGPLSIWATGITVLLDRYRGRKGTSCPEPMKEAF